MCGVWCGCVCVWVCETIICQNYCREELFALYFIRYHCTPVPPDKALVVLVGASSMASLNGREEKEMTGVTAWQYR